MNGPREELLIRSLGSWYGLFAFKPDTIKAHLWFFLVGNAVITLYQQYSKWPPKIPQEKIIMLKLRPETNQVSLTLSETHTHQHLEIYDVQEVCPAITAEVLTWSGQWWSTPVLLSTDVRSRICCDCREDKGGQLLSPCHVSVILHRLATMFGFWIYISETWSWPWAISILSHLWSHQDSSLSFVSKSVCLAKLQVDGLGSWRQASPGGWRWANLRAFILSFAPLVLPYPGIFTKSPFILTLAYLLESATSVLLSVYMLVLEGMV